MDIITDLMGILKQAPQLTIWVIAIIYGFKVVVVGSVYGVIRYAVGTFAGTMNKRTELEHAKLQKPTSVNLHTGDNAFGKVVIDSCAPDLLDFIKAMRTGNNGYAHKSDVDFAYAALKEKRAREGKTNGT